MATHRGEACCFDQTAIFGHLEETIPPHTSCRLLPIDKGPVYILSWNDATVLTVRLFPGDQFSVSVSGVSRDSKTSRTYTTIEEAVPDLLRCIAESPPVKPTQSHPPCDEWSRVIDLVERQQFDSLMKEFPKIYVKHYLMPLVVHDAKQRRRVQCHNALRAPPVFLQEEEEKVDVWNAEDGSM